MKLLNGWRDRWRTWFTLPVIASSLREHEKRIQELEKELDITAEPSEFGNKRQRRQYLELLKDTPLSEEETRQWENGT